MGHKVNSPSVFDRRRACPGSRWLEPQVPDDGGNIHTWRGTAAHQVGEFCLKDEDSPEDYLGEIITVYPGPEADHDVPVKMERDDIDAVKAYVDYVKLRANQIGATSILIEAKATPGLWLGQRDDCDGTLDCGLLSLDCIEAIDYKHGAGVAVEPENNGQLILYALGLCQKVDWTNKDQSCVIKMTIVQPRAHHIRGPVRSWEITAYELFQMLPQLTADLQATDDPNAPRVPGEKQCRFCRGKSTCPEVAQAATQVFNPVAAVAEAEAPATVPQDLEASLLRPVDVLTLEDKVRALDSKALVLGWFKNLEADLLGLAQSGTNVPGYKVVRAQTRRKWGADDDTVVKKLTGMRDTTADDGKAKIKKAEVVEIKPISITQAEKTIRPRVSERSWKGIQKIILKPEGAPVLAPLTDPRDPIKKAEDVFAPVTQSEPAERPPWEQ